MKLVFTTNKSGFDHIEEFRPQLATKFMPDYLKIMPNDNKFTNKKLTKLIPNFRTAKVCPSFIDIYSQAIVLPAPCDIWLNVTKEEMEWRTSNSEILMDIHQNPQFVDYLPEPKPVKGVFKLYYPYYAILPKGYNFIQVPMFYNFNPDWQVAFGQYNADSIAEIVCQILFTSDKEEVLIKAGEPLCMYIPVKREKVKFSFGKFKDYQDRINETIHRNVSKFLYGHRRLR
tara:strand:- start:1988 stop:2674 length:687 start_codon:yes stop_codon:yes gene_type:complete